ncbi:hypothetical protein SDC9_168171 [bioreactor metagenome]|uniref:Uncharacterized protein n=1 Tax=bioreactor metagenome TaxID=1076179 RepID=A0A645G4B1_9ZZZZ
MGWLGDGNDLPAIGYRMVQVCIKIHITIVVQHIQGLNSGIFCEGGFIICNLRGIIDWVDRNYDDGTASGQTAIGDRVLNNDLPIPIINWSIGEGMAATGDLYRSTFRRGEAGNAPAIRDRLIQKRIQINI